MPFDEEYSAVVDELFKSKSDRTIANSSDKHAAVLFGAFFKYAKSEIVIFCEKLNPLIFDSDPVKSNIRTFLERENSKLMIGVTDDRPAPSDFLTEILKCASSESKKCAVKIFHCPKLFSQGKEVNFAIMDGVGYRYEPDSSKCAAIACANDESFAIKLRRAAATCIPVLQEMPR